MMIVSQKTASINEFEGKRHNVFGTTEILFNPLDSSRKNETAGKGPHQYHKSLHRNMSKQYNPNSGIKVTNP